MFSQLSPALDVLREILYGKCGFTFRVKQLTFRYDPDTVIEGTESAIDLGYTVWKPRRL